MVKKLAVLMLLLLTGCASLPFKVTGWGNDSNRLTFENGKRIKILGNPRISCYDKNSVMIANGLFVSVQGDYLVVDQFGTDFIWLKDNGSGNWCSLWQSE